MTQDNTKGKRMSTLPSEDEVFKFEALLEAGGSGRLSLIRGFRAGTDEEVTMIGITNPGGKVAIMPVAVIIEGDPFTQYDPPDELPEQSRIIKPH